MEDEVVISDDRLYSAVFDGKNMMPLLSFSFLSMLCQVTLSL